MDTKDNRILYQKRGERLKACREIRRMTQQELADRVGYSNASMISYFENGNKKNHLNENNVQRIAEVLNVNPGYLLCKSDNPKPSASGLPLLYEYVNHITHTDTTDISFLQFLSHGDYSISLQVYKKHDTSEERLTVTLDQITSFIISNPLVTVSINNTSFEAIVDSITVDGEELSFGEFCTVMYQIYDYIHYVFENIGRTKLLFRTTKRMDHLKNSIVEMRREPLDDLELDQAISDNNLQDDIPTGSDIQNSIHKVFEEKFPEIFEEIADRMNNHTS